HHAFAVQTRPAADDGLIVTERAVAVQLNEVSERELDVVQRVRPFRVPRELHAVHRRERAIRFLLQACELLLERAQLAFHVEAVLAREHLQALDLALQLADVIPHAGLRCAHPGTSFIRASMRQVARTRRMRSAPNSSRSSRMSVSSGETASERERS